MNIIEIDVQVLRNASDFTRISYVQGTNAIPIIFHIKDYEIPQGCEARVYVRRPDGTMEYDTAKIIENSVYVDVKNTMFSVAGNNILQVQVIKEDKQLVTYSMTVRVEKNYVRESVQSGNGTNLFDEAIKEANKAAENANKKAQQIQEKADRGDFTGSIQIGEVNTGEAGSDVLIKNVGSKKDAVLDITIPRGDKGVSMRMRGEWTAGTEYVNNAEYIDLVTYRGSLYGCTASHEASGEMNTTDKDYWICLAEKGETGNVENLDFVKIEFSEAAERKNISSGETIPVIFGKIQKAFGTQPNAFKSSMDIQPTQSPGWLKIAKLPKSSMLRQDIPDSEILTISFSCTPADDSGVYDQACKFVITETWAGSKVRVLNSTHVRAAVVTQVRKVYDDEEQMYYLELEANVPSCPCKLDISFESGAVPWEPIESVQFDTLGVGGGK